VKSKLRFADTLALAWLGLRARAGRTALTSLGIAIGIAAVVAVIGISASGRAELLATLDRLGTNLLRVSAGQGIMGGPVELPEDAPAMAARVGPVEAVTAVARLDATVRRTALIPEVETSGLSVVAVEPDLFDVLGGEMAAGTFLDDGSARLPATVLGSVAAERLGVSTLGYQQMVRIAGQEFVVVGVADELQLHPDLERSALVGFDVAIAEIGEAPLSALYVRVDPTRIDDVVEVIPTTVNPQSPDRVEITRPSDALAAREAADAALTQLLIGLGSVALMVGGVAIANIMVMSVLERRMEIGVRRSLGATKGHIRRQFLTEAILLAGIGGVTGVGLGAGITWGFSAARDVPVTVPIEALIGAVGVALLIGTLAGIYPASRAAAIPPSQAVRGN
jgi:putative ABC transport system permease protein